MDAKHLADALGRGEIAEQVGVRATAVSNAVVRGWFPSSWFLVCQELARGKGVECPPSLFGMKMKHGATPEKEPTDAR